MYSDVIQSGQVRDVLDLFSGRPKFPRWEAVEGVTHWTFVGETFVQNTAERCGAGTLADTATLLYLSLLK